MSSPRHTGRRTTVVRPADPRAARFYEQTSDWPSFESLYAAITRDLANRHPVFITGLVGVPGPLRYADLVALATAQPDGTVGVSMTDLWAAVKLETSAEILLVAGHRDELRAVPIRDALQHDATRLTLGTRHHGLRSVDGGPIRFDAPDWSLADEPLAVRSIRAVTFADFIECC